LKATGDRKVAIFGLGEIYWLAHIYSNLKNFEVSLGLDDNPYKDRYKSLPFPVTLPEEFVKYGITDIILTMSNKYYSLVQERFQGSRVPIYPVFGNYHE